METKQKSSPIWLIILLCAVILGLALLINNYKNQQTVSSLNSELERLNQQMIRLQEQKNQEIQELQKSLITPISSSSATQSGITR